MAIFKCLKKKGGKPKTKGNFRTRNALEKYVINRGRECMPVVEICTQAGVSRTVVDRILQDNKITAGGVVKKLTEMQKVDRITIKHLKEEMVKRDVQIASQQKESPRIDRCIELCVASTLGTDRISRQRGENDKVACGRCAGNE